MEKISTSSHATITYMEAMQQMSFNCNGLKVKELHKILEKLLQLSLNLHMHVPKNSKFYS